MLSQESLHQIDREIAKYPSDQKQSAIMAALRIAQIEKGWLPKDLIEFVANYPVGSTVSGEVEQFSSHGAYVLAGGARCYEAAYGLSETHTCDTFMPSDAVRWGW